MIVKIAVWTVFQKFYGQCYCYFGGSRKSFFHGSRSKTGTHGEYIIHQEHNHKAHKNRLCSKRIHSWHWGRLAMSSYSSSYRNLGDDTDNRKVVDVYLYHFIGSALLCRCCFFSLKWLDDGRPYDLSGIHIATWTFMAKQIHEHRKTMERYRRHLGRWSFAVFLLYMISLHLVQTEKFSKNVTLAIQCIVLVVMIAELSYQEYYGRRHKNQVFIPAVQAVIDNLQPQFREAGYEVVFVVENGCCKPSYGLLRFTSLNNNEEQQAAVV